MEDISVSDDALWFLSSEQRVLPKRDFCNRAFAHFPTHHNATGGDVIKYFIRRFPRIFPFSRKRRLSKSKFVEEGLIFHHPLSYENNSFVNVYTK